MDWTIPVSVATFFVGLILTVRFALPRYADIKAIQARVNTLVGDSSCHAERLTTLDEHMRKHAERLDVAEKNITTVNGNLLTVRDQVQFKGIAASMRGGAAK